MRARVIAHIMLGLLAVVLAALALSQFLGVRYFSVLSGSMEPDIPTGSLVVVAPEELAGSLEAGDVVSYVADENLTVVTHRVIQNDSRSNTLITQGDANEASDPPVLKANVVGKVVFSVPAVGYAFVYLTTATGKIIAVTALVVLYLLSVLIGLLGRKKAKKRLVISYENEDDLTPETFSQIAQGFQMRRGGKP